MEITIRPGERLLNLIFRSPWAILPEKLAAIVEVLELYVQGTRADEARIRLVQKAGADQKAAMQIDGSTAIIPVYGVLSRRMNMFTEMSGGTSTEILGKQIQAAIDDPAVEAIVLDVDSPGGEAAGTPELAAQIMAGRSRKPIVAVANSLMASAAYWIGSAASEIVAAPSAEVGSIGVIMVQSEMSKRNEALGITNTVVKAGRLKGVGNPYEPLTEDGLSALQSYVDEFYAMFVADVAKGRGVSASAVRDGYGEGFVVGADQALGLGMVDRLGTLQATVERLRTGQARAAVARKRGAAIAQLLGIEFGV